MNYLQEVFREFYFYVALSLALTVGYFLINRIKTHKSTSYVPELENEDWEFLKSKVGPPTKTSKVKLIAFAKDHLGRLKGYVMQNSLPNDSLFAEMYNNTKEIYDNFINALTDVDSKEEVRASNGKTLKKKVDNLPGPVGKVMIWRSEIVTIYLAPYTEEEQESDEVQAALLQFLDKLFPQGLKPFRNGRREQMILSVQRLAKTLKDTSASNSAMDAVQQKIQNHYDYLDKLQEKYKNHAVFIGTRRNEEMVYRQELVDELDENLYALAKEFSPERKNVLSFIKRSILKRKNYKQDDELQSGEMSNIDTSIQEIFEDGDEQSEGGNDNDLPPVA